MGAVTPGVAGTSGQPDPAINDGTNKVIATSKPAVTGQDGAHPNEPLVCIPGLGVEGVFAYVGKSVEDFCAFGYGKTGDPQNHCAHFVAHALNIQVGELCSNLLPWNVKDPAADKLFRAGEKQNLRAGLYTLEDKAKVPLKGASTRVNEIYNSVPKDQKGDWDARPDPKANCLMCVTTPGNISKDRVNMGQAPKKHIGIHVDGKIYNYGNTNDQVVCDTIEEFQKKFKRNYGEDCIFLWGAIPDTGTACVYRGSSVST
jgi:hypothetical protein